MKKKQVSRKAKQKILFLEESGRLLWGGGQKVSLEVMKALSSDYSIFLSDSTKKSLFAERACKYHEGFIRVFSYGPDIFQKTFFSRLKRILEFISFPFFLAVNFFIVMFYIKKISSTGERIILYVPAKKRLPLAFLLSLIYKYKYIYHSHLPANKKTMEFKLLLPALKKASSIICVSQYVNDCIGLPNCITVYNGIPLPKGAAPKKLTRSKITIASTSSLLKWKGIEYFMRSYKFLKNKNTVFHIYGSGSEYANLSKLASDKVILRGFTSSLDKVLREEVDILVVPSIEPESYCMSILEGFSFGIPAIAAKLGHPGRIIEGNHLGYCVPPRDSKAIAAKIDELIDHPKVYAEMSLQCLKHAKSMDILLFRRKIKEVFHKIIGKEFLFEKN